MIWKTKTHEYVATICQRTGGPCPAMARMARALAEAMKKADHVTSEGFEIEGSSDLTHCAQGCMARFRAGPEQIRIFCGTEADTPIQTLDTYADLIFDETCAALPSGALPRTPCAMLEVLALRPSRPVQEPARVSA